MQHGDVGQDLLRSAEQLFAKQGIVHLTLDSIPGAADHFTSLEEVVEAISRKYLSRLVEHWERNFNSLFKAVELTPRTVFHALLGPVIALMDEEEGRDWICIAAHLSLLPEFHIGERPITNSDIFARFFGLLFSITSEPPRRLANIRLQLVAGTFYQALAYRVRAEDEGAIRVPRDLYVENLIDVLSAMLDVEPSEHTVRHL